MIGHRTRASLAQFLSQQDHARITILLSKHGAQHIGFSYGSAFPLELLNFVRDLGDQAVLAVLAEVVATQSDLRFHVSPKVRFDERLHDLLQCLAMDGYRVEGKSLRQVDPSITDAPPIEDDLVRALLDSGAPCREIIVSKINDSAQSFRASSPRSSPGESVWRGLSPGTAAPQLETKCDAAWTSMAACCAQCSCATTSRTIPSGARSIPCSTAVNPCTCCSGLSTTAGSLPSADGAAMS